MFALSWYEILISKMYSLLSSTNEIKNRQKKKLEIFVKLVFVESIP